MARQLRCLSLHVLTDTVSRDVFKDTVFEATAKMFKTKVKVKPVNNVTLLNKAASCAHS
jgi:hypothetical protein